MPQAGGDEERKFPCGLCPKSFSSERGRSLHMNSCKRKHAKTAQPSQGESSVSTETTATNARSGDLPRFPPAPRIWGDHTRDDLRQIVSAIYEETVFWRKNIFMLPSGAAGKTFVKEMSRLVDAWNCESASLHDIALKLVMIMPAILLQKPRLKSRSKEHSTCLKRRLDQWERGDFEALLRECKTIQSTLASKKLMTQQHLSRTFAKLMLQGKVNAALRLLDEESSGGVLPLTEDTLRDLKKKHPAAKESNPAVMCDGDVPFVDPALFANIDESTIAKAAMNTKGAAGPSGLDAMGWRHILVSRNYGDAGKNLRSSLATMARLLATKKISVVEHQPTSLEAYLSCRLIPLDKNPGVRPIGIGEVLRRIIGKSIIYTIKPQIMESAGNLQLCAGQQAGCESAVHAMSHIYDEEETDAILLVDATNAFNSVNRKVMLHNIQYICPAIATYAYNCYVTPSRLFVQGGKELSSAEGTTQGDPISMPLYAIAITPLLNLIKDSQTNSVRHVAFADDLSGAGKLHDLRTWWENIITHGPLLGYYPRGDKSWLVVKPHLLDAAKTIFAGTNVQITTGGHKYLGGYIGSDEGKQAYVKSLVDSWCSQLHTLSDIAKHEPQAAYTAFVAGFRHRFTYHIRTIPGIEHKLLEVDNIIDTKFLPAISEGRQLSIDDRKLLALPPRLGGLGIPILVDLCSIENENSERVCQDLTRKIIGQNEVCPADYTAEPVREIRRRISGQREASYRGQLEDLRQRMTKEQIRANDIAQLKGSSIWLTALPLVEEGYVLSKREFFDAIHLRYRWQLKRLPSHCACGKPFTVDHALSCLKGGFIHRRHDEIRDLLAATIDEVAHDVSTEPALAPLSGEILPPSAKTADDARVDIAARGFWQRCEKAFFDVRVFNPYALTHRNQSLASSFNNNEKEKKRHYNERVVRVEHGSFTPVVFSAFGGCGRETQHFLSTLADKIATKRHLRISAVMSWLRKRISFALIRAQVLCIRGCRSWQYPTAAPLVTDIALSEQMSNF